MFKYLKGKDENPKETITNVKALGISAEENLKLTEQKTKYLAHIFHLLGDLTRLKIMLILAKQRICVGDISHKTGFSVSLISHNLRLLRAAELVKSTREGKKIYYTIDEEASELMRQITLIIQKG
jgi:ArsR family transcriptional regulator